MHCKSTNACILPLITLLSDSTIVLVEHIYVGVFGDFGGHVIANDGTGKQQGKGTSRQTLHAVNLAILFSSAFIPCISFCMGAADFDDVFKKFGFVVHDIVEGW